MADQASTEKPCNRGGTCIANRAIINMLCKEVKRGRLEIKRSNVEGGSMSLEPEEQETGLVGVSQGEQVPIRRLKSFANAPNAFQVGQRCFV